MNTPKNFKLTLILVIFGIMSLNTAVATSCSDAGSFEGVCGTIVGLFNASMAVVSIIVTGDNASIIIEAAIVLAIVAFIIDLARGKNSWIRNKFDRI